MTPYIIPALAIIILYVVARVLNKKRIVNTYSKITGSKYLALAALFIVFAIPSLSKDSPREKFITGILVAALVAYFIYKYFSTKKTSQ